MEPTPLGHTIHYHVMLTLSAMDETGKRLPKSGEIYDLDKTMNASDCYLASCKRVVYPLSGSWNECRTN